MYLKICTDIWKMKISDFQYIFLFKNIKDKITHYSSCNALVDTLWENIVMFVIESKYMLSCIF